MRQGRRTSGGVVSVAAPKTIPGLQLWLRADLGVTLNGSNVSAWADQSGNGDANRNAVQATGAQQPPFVASSASYGNQSVINFTSSTGLVTGTWSAALTQPFTVFLIGHTTDNATNNFFFDSLADAALVIDGGPGALTADLPLNLAGLGTTFNTPSACYVVGNGASSQIAVRVRTAQVTGNAGTNGATGLVIGRNVGTNSLLGPLAEIAVYSGALSAGQINTFMTYAAARYGLTIGA